LFRSKRTSGPGDRDVVEAVVEAVDQAPARKRNGYSLVKNRFSS